MTEAEVVKIVLNNGFMVVFCTWVLFRGEPKYREAITTINAKNAATVKAMSEDYRNTIDGMRAVYAQTIETVTSKFESIIQSMQRECREERKEILQKMLENDEKDRQARHAQGDLYQKSLIEIHDMHHERRDSNG